MRNDKYKLFEPPKLKTLSRSKLNGTHRSMRAQENIPLFGDSNIDEFDEVSFKSKYDRALELMSVNKQQQSRNALGILEFLSNQIHRIPQEHTLPYDLIQKVVINCWRIKNSFKTQMKKHESLSFIKNEVQFLTQLYKKRQVHKNGLYMMYLIQANEQFDERLYYDALKSCDLSIKYGSGIKNQPHLLKVQYLKSTIHAALNNHGEELQSIKRCMRFINSLTATTDQQPLKQFIAQLKKNLIERQSLLKDRPSQQKSVDIQARPSSSLFRKRSLSQKKQVKKELTIERPSQARGGNRSLMKSIHTRSANISKYNSATIKQQKPTFLPVDLTKFNKTELKLKKRPLKLQIKNRNNEFNNNMAIDQIQYVQPPSFNFDLLMVRRPNEKIDQFKRSNNQIQGQQNGIEEIESQPLAKKQSSQKEEEKIEPVTHYITKSQHTGNDQILEQQYEQLVRGCVKGSEEMLFKAYLKKINQQEEYDQHEKMSSNLSNYMSKQSNQAQSSFSSANEFQRLQQYSNILLTHSESRNHYQMTESELQIDSSFNSNDNYQLVSYFGILSKFKFAIGLQKKESENEAGQLYKEIYINFGAVLNKRMNLFSTLTFRFYNPYEKNLQIIIEQVCNNELNNVFSGQSIKFKLINLISNRLLIIKKANGFTLVEKQNKFIRAHLQTDSYIQTLRNYFIIYEENKLTDFTRYRNNKYQDYVPRKLRENVIKFRSDQSLQAKEETGGFHQILNYYLPTLIKRMTDDLKEENSSVSSLKRMKTQKFYKNTILSYQSLIKSLNQSDLNAKFTFQDQKSLALVMPSDFNMKVSNFFEHEEGVKETTIYQFYYCMKFILIQPIRTKETSKPKKPPTRRRTSSIANAVKQLDRVKQITMQKEVFDIPVYLQDTINNFYDSISINHLFSLQNERKVNIKMTCYKVKQIFKKSQEYFYKFIIQFTGEKIKMMKFIATSYDISKLMHRKGCKTKQNMLKSSRKIKQKISKEELQVPSFDKKSLLIVLRQISQRIFIKKDYIYSMIGLQSVQSEFHYINKFKLEGKTVQNKQFMIPHLKVIHILLQKSIRVNCDHFKEFAVCTIRQIERSIDFNVIFYFPKYQRTFSVALTTNILDYLLPQHQYYLFDGQKVTKQLKGIMFKHHQDSQLKQMQSTFWNNFSKLFKFQMHYFQDKMQMFLRIGSFIAFLKDSCFSEYFELKNKVFHLQMSLSKKPAFNASEFELKHVRNIHPKRKSSSSKELIKRNNFLQINDMKSSGRVLKPSIRKKCADEVELFKKGDFFQKISKIYETETNKYILFLSLTKIYEMSSEQEQQQQKETHKINYSFHLSDMINLLKQTKKDIITRQEHIENQFNQQVFSFSILVRAMTVIKYKLINELKTFKEIDSLFQGQSTIKTQKQFKNGLIKAFRSQNETLYSLNSIKHLYKLQNNVYLINKHLINSKRNVIATTFFEEKASKITFYLTSSNDHTNKQKTCLVKDMKFPWIEFYQKHQLFKISHRIYSFYKNILLFT